MVGLYSAAVSLLLLLQLPHAVFAQTQHQDEGLAYSPPYYPSPRVHGSGDWQAAYAKARRFVSGLALMEKVNLTTGTGWMMDHCVGNTGL